MFAGWRTATVVTELEPLGLNVSLVPVVGERTPQIGKRERSPAFVTEYVMKNRPIQGGARTTRRTGTATVEMALVCPVLFLMVFGLFEVAYGYMVQHLIEDAARQGCPRRRAGHGERIDY